MVDKKKFKGSLRLDWINKDKSLYYEIDEKENRGIKPQWVDKNDIRVSEPRILNFVKNYGDEENDNILIRGDNLLALRTLVEQFKTREEENKVKCIYIDPPYNTGNAFDKYDDNLKHSEWLTMMRDRLVLLKKLLRKDGVIFVQIDDKELAYLKILMDEIFGRDNFMNSITIKPSNPVGLKMKNADKRIVRTKEFILVYANKFDTIKLNIVYLPYENFSHYNLFLDKKGTKDNKKWKVYKVGDLIAKERGIKRSEVTEEEIKKFALKNLDNIHCSSFIADRRDRIAFSKKNPEIVTVYKNPDGSEMYMFKKRTLFPLKKRCEKVEGEFLPAEILCDLWLDIKWDGIAKEGGVTFLNGKKPEKLLKRVLELTTQEGDLVLDSFAGSGTTGAVAHKMGRKWIMIELGKHAEDLCIKRLQNVIKGDTTGISKIVNWKGGRGFKYYKLGESLISEDRTDVNWKLTYKQIAEALFYAKNFKLIENKKLEKENIFIGENLNEKGVFAVCSVSKNLDSIGIKEYEMFIQEIKDREDFKEINLYTNKALAVRGENQLKEVIVRKIPQTILKKYNLI